MSFEIPAPIVAFTAGRHSVIVVKATDRRVFFVRMQSSGLDVEETSVDSFKREFYQSNYPVARAASHYLALKQYVPVSKLAIKMLEPLLEGAVPKMLLQGEAMSLAATARLFELDGSVLGPVSTSPTPISGNEEEYEMATAKKTTTAKATTKAAPKTKAAAVDEVTTKTKAKAAPAADAQAKKPRTGVTAFIKDQLLDGKEAEEIVMLIAEQFPESKAGKNEINWCRSALRKEGKL